MSKKIELGLILFLSSFCTFAQVKMEDSKLALHPQSDYQKFRSEWLAIGDIRQQYEKYVAFTPQQRQDMRIAKMEEMLSLDWTEPERLHIQSYINLIKENAELFLLPMNETPQKVKDKMKKWFDDAIEELGWSGESMPLFQYHNSFPVFHVMSEAEKKFLKQPKGVNLVAPNGVRIAEDIESLKKDISKNWNDHSVFEITNIEYLPVLEGVRAFISYRFDHGKSDRIFMHSDDSRSFSSTLEKILAFDERFF